MGEVDDVSCGCGVSETTEVTTTTEPALVDVKTLVLLCALMMEVGELLGKTEKLLAIGTDGVTKGADTMLADGVLGWAA